MNKFNCKMPPKWVPPKSLVTLGKKIAKTTLENVGVHTTPFFLVSRGLLEFVIQCHFSLCNLSISYLEFHYVFSH